MKTAQGQAQSAPPAVAVIVAAGKGQRLGGGVDLPKPLAPIVGVPLVARVMTAAHRAGFRRFFAVLGFEAERLRRELPALVPPGCELECVENPRFDEPNGVSLLVAARKLDEPFALLMADHLFAPVRLARARERFTQTGRCMLVVEPKASFAGDWEDATLVRTRDGRVTDLAKGLDPFNAIDTGMFVLRPQAVVRALDAAGPAPSITDGMRQLAAAGGLDAFDPKQGAWQDVDTPADVAAAERMLYRSLTKPQDGLMARLVNRRISLFFSTRLWRLGITPNMVTAFTLLLGLAAGAAFAQGGSARWGLWGAALFQLQSILDGVDGELARLLHKESRFGFWFDVSADNLTHIVVFGGIACGQAVDGHPGPWGLLGLLAGVGVLVSFALMAPLLRASGAGTGEKGLLGRLVDGLSRRDFTYLLFPLAALELLGSFLWVVVIGTWAYAGTLLWLRARRPG